MIVTITEHFTSDPSGRQRSYGNQAYFCDSSDRERLSAIAKKLMETTSAVTAAIVMIVTIPAIIWKPLHSDRNDRDDHSDRMCPAI